MLYMPTEESKPKRSAGAALFSDAENRETGLLLEQPENPKKQGAENPQPA